MVTKPLRVWGGNTMTSRGQYRAIVAAFSKREAMEILSAAPILRGVTRSYFDDYWAETGNQGELEIAQVKGAWINWAGNRYADKPLWEHLTPPEPVTPSGSESLD